MTKPFVPTNEQRAMVESMAGFGIPHDDIARVVKIDPKTLRLRFRDELDLGATKANAAVAQFLFNQAKGGSASAAIFWLKARAGWRDVQQTQQLDENGKPITPGNTFVWTVLRDGETPALAAPGLVAGGDGATAAPKRPRGRPKPAAAPGKRAGAPASARAKR